MSLETLTLFVVASIVITYAAVIPPTSSDANTEYYLANTTKQFETGYILCSGDKQLCHVICDAEDSCSQSTINSTLTPHLILECNGRYSCEGLTVFGPNTSVDVQCIDYRSCRNGVFDFVDTKTVNIVCDGQGTYSCSTAVFNAQMAETLNIECNEASVCSATFNGTFVSGSINVFCSTYNSCNNAKIYGLQSNEVNVECNDAIKYGSCRAIYLYCASSRENQCNFDCGDGGEKTCNQVNLYIANDNFTIGFLSASITDGTCTSAYDCSYFYFHCMDTGATTSFYYSPEANASYCSDYDCCPISHFQLNAPQCDAGEDCIIDCAQDDPFGVVGCKSLSIDASNAKSLTLLCETERNSNCIGTQVLCPIDGDCNIVCSGDSICYSMDVNATLSTNTSIRCGTEANEESCRSMTVVATDNTNVDVYCIACDSAGFDVSNSESVNVVCNASNACTGGITAKNTTLLNVLCDAEEACSIDIRSMGAEEVNVNCAKSQSCSYLTLMCPTTDNSCNVICADTNSTLGSCTRAYIYFDHPSLFTPDESIFSLSCPPNEYDCADVRFDCEHYYEALSGQSPNTDYSWEPTVQEFRCQDTTSSRCCPFYKQITCEPDKDCNIICNSSTLCDNTVFNGKNATSLSISCTGTWCDHSYIQCPLQYDSSCSIHGTFSGSKFYGNGATDIDIQCGDACGDDLYIDIISENNTVNLNCSGWGCNKVQYSNYGNNSVSNIYCNSCKHGARFNIYSAESVLLSCDGSWACFDGFIEAKSNEVIIECNDERSCGRLWVMMSESEKMTLNANLSYTFALETDSDYNKPKIYPPYHDKHVTQINCGVDQECHGLMIFVPREYVYDFLDINCDDTINGCSNVSVTCTDTWLSSTLVSTGDDYYCDSSKNCCPFTSTDTTATMTTTLSQSTGTESGATPLSQSGSPTATAYGSTSILIQDTVDMDTAIYLSCYNSLLFLSIICFVF